ncbi:hypothetical protein [Pleionea litopenaei]|uniref:Uncharacterized protein n=1 Tax=Pleionea litopenaei TaxID=3070815 RepID=A0AA51X8D6_9GAMM|nr:hypothetical protein [Pleionea sp. HL-JVS1]WMS88824.1 hypothetical protein Q9312_07870 [Pleionea sp. HL-JVS1]
MIPDSYYFKSSLFNVERGEDEETNLGIYGKQLARWLRDGLIALGYEVEPIIAEDWGWCVMCQRKPFSLWVDCGSLDDQQSRQPFSKDINLEAVIWHCFVELEIPFWRKFFNKPDSTVLLEKLKFDLHRLLTNNHNIEMQVKEDVKT